MWSVTNGVTQHTTKSTLRRWTYGPKCGPVEPASATVRSPDDRAEADRANNRFTLQSVDHSLHVFHRVPYIRGHGTPVQKHRESDTGHTAAHRPPATGTGGS